MLALRAVASDRWRKGASLRGGGRQSRCTGFTVCSMLALLSAGCGELHYKAEYDDATLTGPGPDAYAVIITGEQFVQSRIQHQDVVNLWLRFANGTVCELATISEEEASARSSHVDRETSPGLVMYSLASGCCLHFRNGDLVGASLAEGIEIGKAEQGPFIELPLTGEEMRDLLGEPNAETTFRGAMRWN